MIVLVYRTITYTHDAGIIIVLVHLSGRSICIIFRILLNYSVITCQDSSSSEGLPQNLLEVHDYLDLVQYPETGRPRTIISVSIRSPIMSYILAEEEVAEAGTGFDADRIARMREIA
jgi:hypothetical protein